MKFTDLQSNLLKPSMFELLKTDASSRARLGRLTTSHGVVDTPVFMSVGTQGSVKALDPRELCEMRSQIILGNTYHLSIRPGLEIIKASGGLHSFINWPAPILTDSGGFQVFSLATIRKIQAHGVEFRSHLDGSLLFLGPKEAMAIPTRTRLGHRHGVLTIALRIRALSANSVPQSNAPSAGPGMSRPATRRRPNGFWDRSGRDGRNAARRVRPGLD
jgi:hypothetical protein